jgi:hypothetical protein
MFKLLNKNKPNSGIKITLFAQIFQKIKRDSFNKLAEKFVKKGPIKIQDKADRALEMMQRMNLGGVGGV